MFFRSFLFDTNLGLDCIVIELKLFNLIGLYSGNLHRNKSVWVDHLRYDVLVDFDKKLREESEESLLERYYTYWCKNERKYKSIKIKSMIDSGYANILRWLLKVELITVME